VSYEYVLGGDVYFNFLEVMYAYHDSAIYTGHPRKKHKKSAGEYYGRKNETFLYKNGPGKAPITN
jgi:hypothetical protein